MNTFNFKSQFEIIGHMPSFSQEQVKNEPMFFNSSLDFAYNNGGPITKIFIDSLPDTSTTDYVLDSRVHMLMNGWYSCIPGWHHDDVPRSTANGQPNYHNPEYHSDHILALVNGNICPTEFAVGDIELPDVEDGVYYRQWHPLIETAIEQGSMKCIAMENDPIVKFNAHSFHKGTKAKSNGWRWFARVSTNTDRTKNKTNEIRNQVQVYIPAPDYMGW